MSDFKYHPPLSDQIPLHSMHIDVVKCQLDVEIKFKFSVNRITLIPRP